MVDYPSLSEADLVRRITRHDQQALAELYARFGMPVYSLCLRTLQQQGLAEEATQDTFMKVWQNPGAWDAAKGRFSSWLLTVARHTAIDRLRKETRQVTDQAHSLDGVQVMSEHGLPHDPLLRDGHLLRALLRELPAEQAQVIDMGFFQGLTHRELAEKLDLPLGTVKTRVRLGLQKLRALWIEATREPE